jgi:hypothetical protein
MIVVVNGYEPNGEPVSRIFGRSARGLEPLDYDTGPTDLMTQLYDFGRKGWELVSFTSPQRDSTWFGILDEELGKTDVVGTRLPVNNAQRMVSVCMLKRLID